MFKAVLLQGALHAVAALLHALGEVSLSRGVVLLHGLHPLQLGVQATHVCRAHLRSAQQLQNIRHDLTEHIYLKGRRKKETNKEVTVQSLHGVAPALLCCTAGSRWSVAAW